MKLLGTLRVRLMALVVLAIIPVFGLLLYDALDQRRTALARAESETLLLAQQIALGQQELIGGAHQLLAGLSQLGEVQTRDAIRCSAVFADILTRFRLYANLGAAAPNGDVFCSALALGVPINIADRPYFRRALSNRAFVVGDYQVGRATGKATLNFGYPALGPGDHITAVVVAALDLTWLEHRVRLVKLPAGAAVTVLDRAGTVLVQHPAGASLVGQQYKPSVVKAIGTRHEALLEDDDLGGERRLFAFVPLLGRQHADGPHIVISLPTRTVFAKVHTALLRNLAFLLMVGALALVAAWFASGILILRQTNALRTAARRLAAGDLNARIGPPYGEGELHELARTFDEMASAIEHVTRQNRLILESVGEGICGVDRSGRVTFVNPTAARLSGFAPDELRGQPMHQKLHHSRPDGRPYPPEQCPTAEALRRGVTREACDEVFWRKDGTSFHVEYVSTPIRHGNDIEGAVVAFRDVSERKQIEAELRRQQESLHQSEKVATMGSLLAGVAHELNNPLAVVMGQCMLLRQTVKEAALVQRAEKINAAAERCGRIVRNFLALARQRPPERGAVRLNQVVREALELLAYELRTDNVEVVLELADDLPTIWADAHQLHQVVVNIVANAHHAMRKVTAPRRLTLRTSGAAGSDRARLDVADTGSGIPAELQKKIFEPFFTTKPPGEGTGLGLSLCRGIIEEHHGVLAVESEPGRGTTFTITLPIGESQVTGDASPTPEPAAAVGRRCILVVDDEPEIAAVLAETLERDGHEVMTAANGAAALEALAKRTFDLVLTDTKMPNVDGVEFHRELHRLHPSLRQRVVFLTGDLLNREKHEFLERTGAPVLPKPFDLQEVRRTVNRVLAGVESPGLGATAR